VNGLLERHEHFTVFSLPKSFAGHTGVIQRNALRSWSLLGFPVILLGDDAGVGEAAVEFGATHVPSIERNKFGTPLVSSLFAVGESAATTEFLCYVNADIILRPDISTALRALASFDGPFLCTGRRWDVEIYEDLVGDAANFDRAVVSALRAGQLHSATGLDYFIYRRGLYQEIPPFAIGRTCWDNWLLWAALRRGAALIDATESVTAVHQWHDYGHVSGGIEGTWKGPEAQRNLQVAGGLGHIADLTYATHGLIGGQFVQRRGVPVSRRVRGLLQTAKFRATREAHRQIDWEA
jgi:hypothetical protein